MIGVLNWTNFNYPVCLILQLKGISYSENNQLFFESNEAILQLLGGVESGWEQNRIISFLITFLATYTLL